MNRFLLALVLVFLKFFWAELFRGPWLLFDPLLAAVVVYVFFHGWEMRSFVFYALFCGLLSDVFSLDVFGVHAVAYLAAALAVSWFSRQVYRRNLSFLLPAVFLASLLVSCVVFLLRASENGSAGPGGSGWLFLKFFIDAGGTMLFAFFFYHFSRKCALDFIV